jgi:hypothetical protein
VSFLRWDERIVERESESRKLDWDKKSNKKTKEMRDRDVSKVVFRRIEKYLFFLSLSHARSTLALSSSQQRNMV